MIIFINMEEKYERFSDRLRKCTEDGTLVREDCHWCGHTLLMCKKYGGLCKSSKCRRERIGKIIN